MRGLEGRRLPCGTEVRLRQRGAGTPPSPSPSPLLLLLPLRLPLRPVLVSCTVALLGVTHSHAHCVFLVLYSWIDPSCFFLRIFNRSSYLNLSEQKSFTFRTWREIYFAPWIPQIHAKWSWKCVLIALFLCSIFWKCWQSCWVLSPKFWQLPEGKHQIVERKTNTKSKG